MDNMNESIEYTNQIDSNIVELIVDTFIDNEEVVVENDMNEEHIDYDINEQNSNSIIGNYNQKDSNNKKRKKGKQLNQNKSNDEMDLFPKRIKTGQNDVYVFDLQLSALQLEVDFSKLTFISLAKYLQTEQSAFIFAIKLGFDRLL